MGKRRIYEVAKELGVESKDLLKKLQDIGADVKSHSSTVDDDDIKRAMAGPAPKKTEVKRAPGMVVRKKADIPVAEAPQHEEMHADHDDGAHHHHEGSHPQDDVYATAQHAAVSHETREERHEPVAQQRAETADETRAPVQEFHPQHTDAAADRPVQSSVPVKESEPQTVHTQSETQKATQPVATTQAPSAVQAQSPGVPNTVPPQAGTPAKPGEPAPTTGARVVRMIDRDKLISRIPQRRPMGPGGPRGPGGPPGYRPGPGGPPRPGAPGGFRPGFGPRPGPGSLEPQMPHPNRFGPVKELRVTTDAFGKGRQLHDVSADKKKTGPGGGARPDNSGRREKLDKRSLMGMHDRNGSMSRLRRRRGIKRATPSTTAMTMKQSKRVIRMEKETMTVSELAAQLSVKAVEIVRKLMELGTMATMNQSLDADTVTLVAQQYNFTVNDQSFDEDEFLDEEAEDAAETLKPRPPVVTVMGHVDHGKTSLLDAIRSGNVAEGEAGGITQHIGAYMVHTNKGNITFLDTPGHEAFTSMRARGAEVTDLVILVVAADDGPMPQTVEAIRHAQEAKVPIIVAVNKIDKQGAKPDQIMQALTEYQLVPEEWGGDTMYVKTSAVKHTGIDELLDAILLQSEVLQLGANPDKRAIGAVIEARLDKGMGPKATVIVQEGTLRVGDYVVVGSVYGRVRALINDLGESVQEAGPSMPVEIVGLDGVPGAGDQLNAVESQEDAKAVSEHRAAEAREKDHAKRAPKVSLDDLFAKLKGAQSNVKEFKIIIKGDVQGSVEALSQAFRKLSTSEVTLSIVHSAVGAVTEGDVTLASTAGAVVIAFNVKADAKAKSVAETEGVEIKSYNIIYNALDDVKKAMGGLLTPTTKEQSVGRAEVRQVFNTPKLGVVAGCAVTDGKIVRSARARVTRDGKQVFDGKVVGLKRFKDDAREVAQGFECGIVLDGFTTVAVGDVIEAYEVLQIARTLDSSPPVGSAPVAGGRSPGRPSGANASP
jgi:translation initiation factor IF-2